MHKPLINICVGAVIALSAMTATALEFRSASKHGVFMFDAPSEKGRKVFVLSQGTPLEVLVEQNDWLRVRDQAGSLAWMRKQDLSGQRTLQVTKQAVIYREANVKSAVSFRAEPGLLLNLVENTKTGWIKVKHRDGELGFIRIEEVWGL